MAIFENMFEVLTVKDPEGRPGIKVHVAVAQWMVPKELLGKKDVMCLTADALESTEFNMHIDELIDQLKKLKPKAAAKFRREKEKQRRSEIRAAT